LLRTTQVPKLLAVKLETKRIVVFVQDVPKVAQFYREVLGLVPLTCPDDPKDWQEFAAGAISIALHQADAPKPRRIATKIVFYSQDVASTKRELEGRGAKLGRIIKTEHHSFFNGTDPEGNPFSVSSRV
jgi:predicted enzyme related to lactoylglutathione lyase